MKRHIPRIGAIALLLTLLLSAASCAGSGIEVPDGMQLCSDEGLEYCFFVPAAWTVNTKNGTTSAYRSLTGLEDPLVSVTVTAYAPETALDVAGYWDLCEEEYRSEFNNYAFLSETATTVAALNATEYVYTADFAGTTYQFSQTIFIERSQFYIITYTAPADSYDTFYGDLAQMKAELYFR